MSDDVIPIAFPDGTNVVGEILRSYEGREERLSQDILQAALPNGIVVDVGWLPRFDPSGMFRIVVIRGEDWDTPLYGVDIRNPLVAAEVVEDSAFLFAKQSA